MALDLTSGKTARTEIHRSSGLSEAEIAREAEPARAKDRLAATRQQSRGSRVSPWEAARSSAAASRLKVEWTAYVVVSGKPERLRCGANAGPPPAPSPVPRGISTRRSTPSNVAVFGGAWHYAAADGAGREPGSFVTIEIAGEPIVVVRGDDGVLRAFHNVCRHRAAQIINQPEGQVTKLRCRYHG